MTCTRVEALRLEREREIEVAETLRDRPAVGLWFDDLSDLCRALQADNGT
eukprot:CAMPEP_0118972292 /NCGR_PEP_ID=MMETSP1173-20130426/8637_1 /TAXON_ID=1034831 /ORGANISM="Rhizochromulina marina cf, Strain CCMP1243" /LENGTH=49 /DNA_ID=CAMNT_0006921813 /DNA_START=31 /DNA_END=180 /DNA_ORIENTATION=+